MKRPTTLEHGRAPGNLGAAGGPADYSVLCTLTQIPALAVNAAGLFSVVDSIHRYISVRARKLWPVPIGD